MPVELPTADELPDAMTDRDQWLCWRTEQRNDKPTKVPIDPSTGRYGSATDPDCWTSFDVARERAQDSDDGIGFAFSADGPLVGVDLDDCRVPETETTAEWAADVVATLESYTEVSPSGTGYHVLLAGTVPGDRSRRGDVEIYETDRFFTVTGDHVDGTPTAVQQRSDALADVYAEHIADDAVEEPDDPSADATPARAGDAESAAPERDGVDLADEELLDRARSAANGEKFQRLWRGHTGGYQSHSEADMALCSLLAFWTGGDPDRVDDLFRQSGLLRDKWDEVHYGDGSTYGEKTVERAVRGTDETYDPQPDTADTTVTEPETADAQTAAPATDAGADQESVDTTVAQAPRSEVDLRTVERLQQELERLHDERDDLRAELAAERARRRELERELAEADSDPRWRTRLKALFTGGE